MNAEESFKSQENPTFKCSFTHKTAAVMLQVSAGCIIS